jgi:hypothetical protein
MRTKQILIASLLAFLCQIIVGQFWDPEDITGADTLSFETFYHPLLSIDTNTIGLWRIGEPLKPTINNAYDGVIVMITDTLNAYDTSTYSTFQVTIPHGEGGRCELVFWHWYETTIGKDGGFIEVSYNMGQTWHNIFNSPYPYYDDELTNFYSGSDLINDQYVGFSGSSGGWIKSYITWFGFAPDKKYTGNLNNTAEDYFDTTLVRFVFVSDSIQESLDGWAIDRIIAIYYKDWTGIDIPSSESEYLIFPNPVQDILSIETDEFYNRIIIYNIAGKELFMSDSYLERVNLSALPSGTYRLNLYMDNKLLYSSHITKLSEP